MTSSGTICSCSKFLAQMPMMKPKRLKDMQVSSRKAIIQIGWSIWSGTKRPAVARMIRPIASDFVAAAPT